MRNRKKTKRLRKIKLTSELQDAIQRQLQAFRDKFGRDPGPDDPVFFDDDTDAPSPMALGTFQREFIGVMTRAGISPALVYAYRRTGLIVTEENYGLLSANDRTAWDSAIEEYCRDTSASVRR